MTTNSTRDNATISLSAFKGSNVGDWLLIRNNGEYHLYEVLARTGFRGANGSVVIRLRDQDTKVELLVNVKNLLPTEFTFVRLVSKGYNARTTSKASVVETVGFVPAATKAEIAAENATVGDVENILDIPLAGNTETETSATEPMVPVTTVDDTTDTSTQETVVTPTQEESAAA